MARGEQGARERGAGLAIAAAFGVLCLLVLFGVLAVTRACEPGGTPPPPYMTTAPEPFSGAFAAAARIGTPACRQLGPGLTPSSYRSDLGHELEERGYVAEGEWSPPTAMPAEVQASGCGYVAAVADGGFIASALEDATRQEVQCGGERALFSTCGQQPMSIQGQGDLLSRVYLAPGMTAADVAASDFDLPVLLAHAEAEVTLGELGFSPSEELVVEDLGVVVASYYHTTRPPAVPDEGCVLWVGVASGLGNATATWSGEPGAGFMPATTSSDQARRTASFAAFACGADAGALRATSEVSLLAPEAGPARIVYRAYAPPAHPGPGVTPASTTIARARKVDAGRATLPDTVPFVRPEVD